ncbi:MAG: hypothetical protein HY811_10155 [Planctomycetes bacterium]|nr:hypothetical protein [Planctomycetota bacterium]
MMNYIGSRILAKAVEKGIISEIEAEIVVKNACYERSFIYISLELSMPTKVAERLYNGAIPKLRKWLHKEVIIMPRGKIICD